jgi:hypothetical protein
MFKTSAGTYRELETNNMVGFKSKPTVRSSPILTKKREINNITFDSNIIEDIFIYPKKVTVNGTVYKESFSRTLNDDEYFYDNFRSQLIFNNVVSKVLIEYHENPIIKGDITLALGFPILGASLTRNWQEHATGSISLAVPLEGLQAHLDTLRDGREFEWLGVPLAIGSISINQTPELSKIGLLELTIQVEGKWINYIKPAQYTDSTNLFGITTLQQIAQRNGAVLEFPIYPVVIPRDSFLEAFDWFNLLEGIGKTNKQFVYLSDNSAIKLKNINLNPTKIISNPIDAVKVTQNKSYEFHGKLTPQNLLTARDNAENYTQDLRVYDKIYYPYGNTKYPYVFDNVKISSDIFLYEDGRVQNEILQYLNFTDFKYRSREKRKVTRGSRECPNFVTGKVRDLSVASDITGYTQSYIETVTIDDKPSTDLEELWGFLVNSDDVGKNLRSKWSLISSVTTIHNYNSLGYYLGYTKQGFKKERYEIEDPKNPKNLTDQNRKLYQWTGLPVKEDYFIILASFDNYYIVDDEGKYVIENDSITFDKTYIKPLFVIGERKSSSSIELIDNPKNKNFKLTKGSEKVNLKQVIPFSVSNTPYYISPSSYSQMELQELRDKEGYTTTEINFSSEGGQFNTSIVEDSGTFVKGQPPIAAVLPPLYSKTQTIDEEKLKPPILSNFFKAIVVKNKDYNGDNRGRSLSYPEASTLDDVKKSVYTDWLFNNIKNGVTVSFTIQGLYNGFEGESIILNTDNILYRGVILSIQYNVKTNLESFEINNLDSETEIKMGLLPEDIPEDLIDFVLIRKPSFFNFGDPIYVGGSFSANSIVFSNSRYSLS